MHIGLEPTQSNGSRCNLTSMCSKILCDKFDFSLPELLSIRIISEKPAQDRRQYFQECMSLLDLSKIASGKYFNMMSSANESLNT